MDDNKKHGGYIVVKDTGIDEKDEIYESVFVNKKDALNFIKDLVVDDWLESGNNKPDKLVDVPYYIVPLERITNYNEQPEIEIVDKVSIYTTFYNSDIDFDQNVWHQIMAVPYDANCQLNLVSLNFISVSDGRVDKIRFDFCLPESIFEKCASDDNLGESLRSYCLEMVNLINKGCDKYCTNSGIRIPQDDLNDMHKKVCTIIANKYKNDIFIKLFKKEDTNE